MNFFFFSGESGARHAALSRSRLSSSEGGACPSLYLFNAARAELTLRQGGRTGARQGESFLSVPRCTRIKETKTRKKVLSPMAPPEAARVDAEPLSDEAVQKKSIRELTLRSVKRTYEMFDGHHTMRPPMHEARWVETTPSVTTLVCSISIPPAPTVVPSVPRFLSSPNK